MTAQEYLEAARGHYEVAAHPEMRIDISQAHATAGLLAIELFKIARTEEQLKELDLLSDRLKAVTERGKR